VACGLQQILEMSVEKVLPLFRQEWNGHFRLSVNAPFSPDGSEIVGGPHFSFESTCARCEWGAFANLGLAVLFWILRRGNWRYPRSHTEIQLVNWVGIEICGQGCSVLDVRCKMAGRQMGVRRICLTTGISIARNRFFKAAVESPASLNESAPAYHTAGLASGPARNIR
jgi:hypothetical protein